jgi:hypothetical protein
VTVAFTGAAVLEAALLAALARPSWWRPLGRADGSESSAAFAAAALAAGDAAKARYYRAT